MNVFQAIEHVEESKKFKNFSSEKKSDKYYLAHAFASGDAKGISPWQISYYSKKTKKIVPFTADEEIIQGPEDEAFRSEGHVVPLNMEPVKTSLDDALKKAYEFKDVNNKAENITKSIIILQQDGDYPVWRITLVTHAFSLLTVVVNAVNGEVASTHADSVLNLGQRV